MDARSNPTVIVVSLQATELKETGPPGNSVTGQLVLLTVVDPEFPGNWAPTSAFWANTIIEQLFAKSLGKIERNLVEKGCAGIPGAPWIRQCFCTCRTTRS